MRTIENYVVYDVDGLTVKITSAHRDRRGKYQRCLRQWLFTNMQQSSKLQVFIIITRNLHSFGTHRPAVEVTSLFVSSVLTNHSSLTIVLKTFSRKLILKSTIIVFNYEPNFFFV